MTFVFFVIGFGTAETSSAPGLLYLIQEGRCLRNYWHRAHSPGLSSTGIDYHVAIPPPDEANQLRPLHRSLSCIGE
jgi:hypothetical protein